VVIPGTLTTVSNTVMPIARRGSDRLASHADPCVPCGPQKREASKTEKLRVSNERRALSLFHAKIKTRIACWNVCTLTAPTMATCWTMSLSAIILL
jgi:hypothetical protein